MTLSRTLFFRLLPSLGLALLGAALCAFLIPREIRAVDQQLLGFPDSDAPAHLARIAVLAALCILPAIAALAYALGGTLDRYIARQFFKIFLICLSALFLVWLIIDLQDNITEFRDSGNIALTILTFYASRLPAILLFLLPYGLLLSLLYALGKLSADREIVAMIQSGRGILRLTAPLILFGILCSLLSLGLNYHWAPDAEGQRDGILARARGQVVSEASNVLFNNSAEGRLWLIGTFPQDYEKGAPLLDVEITTTRSSALVSRLSAKEARWNRDDRTWTFDRAVIGNFTPGSPPLFESPADPVFRAWPETPWLLIKPGLSAAYLGIPDLNGWLRARASSAIPADPAPYLTQWHYRWALPFTCLVTVLLATPLGIHFSRRGPGGGIFLAVILSALLLLLNSISLALGEAGVIGALEAAWLPNLVFSLLGLYLFHRRMSGRPIYQHLLRLLPGTD